MEDERSGSVWASPVTMGAAAFMVLVVGLGIWVATRPEPKAAGTPVPSATDSGGDQSAKGGLAANQDPTIPTTAPKTLWRLYHGVALPTSKTAGPAKSKNALVSGFAHTPTGALMAAPHRYYRLGLADDWKTVLDTTTVPGPGQAVWAATMEKAEANNGGVVPHPQPDQICQISGFRFVDYTPSRTTISIAARCPKGTYNTYSVTLQWLDEDWKVVLQPDGQPGLHGPKVAEISDYIAWGGV